MFGRHRDVKMMAVESRRIVRPSASGCGDIMRKVTLPPLVLVLLVMALGAVAGGCIRWTTYSPTPTPADRDPDKVYAAAVRVFLRKGWGFQQRDPNARAVETDWITYSVIGSHPYLSHRILISSSSIDLFTSCRMDHPSWGEMGGECPKNKRPQQLGSIERSLVAEILKEADALDNSTGAAPQESPPQTAPSHSNNNPAPNTRGASHQTCVPGIQISCACPAGAPSGVQVCSDDGARYLQCQCSKNAGTAPSKKP